MELIEMQIGDEIKAVENYGSLREGEVFIIVEVGLSEKFNEQQKQWVRFQRSGNREVHLVEFLLKHIQVKRKGKIIFGKVNEGVDRLVRELGAIQVKIKYNIVLSEREVRLVEKATRYK